MSLKRVATSNLNHLNWNEEDPSDGEKAGTFTPATKETLEKRVIKQAKRRFQPSSEKKGGVFSGFAGFNKPLPTSFDSLANLTNGSNNTNGGGTKNETAVTSSLFSSKPTATPSGGLFGSSSTDKPAFGASTQNASSFSSTKMEIPTMTFSSSKADSTVGDSPIKSQSVSSSADSNAKLSTAAQVSSSIFGVSSTSPNQNKSSLTNTAFKQPESSTTTAPQANSSKVEAPMETETDIEKARNKYYSRLKGLNESVSCWIVKHVEKTPLCFLSPIFKDYENYLKEIQEEYEAAKVEIEAKSKQDTETKPVFGFKDGGSSLFTNKSSVTQDAKPNQVFGINATSSGNTNKATGLFGQTTAPTVSQSASNTTTPTKGFSFGASSTNTNSSVFTTNTDKTGGSPSGGFSFGVTSTPSSTFDTTSPNNTISPPSKGFSFGVASNPAATPPKSMSPFTSASGANTSSPVKGFSFGMMSTPATTSPTNSVSNSAIGATPFSFGSSKPFSFNSQTQPKSTETPNEEDEDQPPKVEYTPVVEENSVFDKKCKIFVKKDGNFTDKGVGTLYVKKIPDNGKHQLLVRANTNLGTVLLNLLLSSAIPMQRMGKNNVMLVCIPTPDTKPPPTPVLIRVKTGEEADDLLETLNKYKS